MSLIVTVSLVHMVPRMVDRGYSVHTVGRLYFPSISLFKYDISKGRAVPQLLIFADKGGGGPKRPKLR